MGGKNYNLNNNDSHTNYKKEKKIIIINLRLFRSLSALFFLIKRSLKERVTNIG